VSQLRVTFLSLICASLALQAQSTKIHQDVQRAAATASSGKLLPVFIVLSHQPQDAILAGLRFEAGRDQTLQDGSALQARARLEIERELRPIQERLEASLRSGGAQRTARYRSINMITAEVPAGLLETLDADPQVAKVFLAKMRTSASIAQSAVAIGAPAFWNAGFIGGGQPIALVDSGVRTNHPAFAGKNLVNQVFLEFGQTHECFADNLTAQDTHGHGTHIAGILMSQGSTAFTNYLGIARGISTLYNAKVSFTAKAPCLENSGLADDRDLIAAVEWAASAVPFSVINLSLGAPVEAGADDDWLTNVVDQIADIQDAFIAVAAGNNGPDAKTVIAPAIGHNIVSVANWWLVEPRSIWQTSSRGPTNGGRFKPDIAAPGRIITSTAYDWDATSATSDDWTDKSGTSMAAPHIAGAAALLGSAGVTQPLERKAILLNSTDDSSGWAADRGWGYVNLNNAFAQRTFRHSTTVTSTGYQFYRVTAPGSLTATVTWNRHLDGGSMTPRFNNLDLFAYTRGGSSQIASSVSAIQNVEKISLQSAEDIVLKVDTAAGNPSLEFFGIAMSKAFTPSVGPVLAVSCTQPSSASANTAFGGTCTVTNNGDLTAFGVSLQLGLPNGFSGASSFNLGNVAAGGSATANTSLSSSQSGVKAVPVTATSGSYGETITGGTSFAVTINSVGGGPGAPGNPSPAAGASGVAVAGSLTWSAGSGATSYDVYFGASNPPTLLGNTTALNSAYNSLTPGVTYFWQVVARNAQGSAASPVWSFTAVSSAGLRFVPVTPCRLVDTRSAAGPLGGPALVGQAARSFPLSTHACVGGANPAAYSLNITVVPKGSLGYLTVWPSGQAQPLVSTLNSLDGRVKANAAIVPAGAGGSISVFVTNDTELIIDVNGYFVPSTGMAFYPLTPCRVVDTRNAAGPLGAPSMAGVQARSFPVRSACNVPATATAYSLNATVVPKTPVFGYLTLWPTGQVQPLVSTLNAVTGTVTANAAIVPAGTNGEVSAFATDASELILDINGYFAPAGAVGALTFSTVTPCRILDTRNTPNGALAGPALVANTERSVPVATAPACTGPLGSARAYSLNATVVPTGPFGYLSMWPTGLPQPLVSTLNAVDGAITSNAGIVPAVSAGGAISVLGSNGVHLILDLNGVFLP
jgi:subtilisin family serine protease